MNEISNNHVCWFIITESQLRCTIDDGMSEIITLRGVPYIHSEGADFLYDLLIGEVNYDN